MLAAQICRLHPGLVLLQDRNDLLFRSASSAAPSGPFLKGQPPARLGSIQGGNVTAYDPGRGSIKGDS